LSRYQTLVTTLAPAESTRPVTALATVAATAETVKLRLAVRPPIVTTTIWRPVDSAGSVTVLVKTPLESVFPVEPREVPPMVKAEEAVYSG